MMLPTSREKYCVIIHHTSFLCLESGNLDTKPQTDCLKNKEYIVKHGVRSFIVPICAGTVTELYLAIRKLLGTVPGLRISWKKSANLATRNYESMCRVRTCAMQQILDTSCTNISTGNDGLSEKMRLISILNPRTVPKSFVYSGTVLSISVTIPGP
jgi:hypothetical protein